MTRRLVGSAILAAGLVTVGCSSTTRLDTSEIEQTLEADYLTVPDVSVAAADCPEEVDVAVGDDFECTLEVEDQVLTVIVTVESSSGDVSLAQADELLVTADLQTLVAEQLESGLVGPLDVRCGETAVIVVPAEGQVTCTTTDASGAAFDVVVEMGPEGIVEVSRPDTG